MLLAFCESTLLFLTKTKKDAAEKEEDELANALLGYEYAVDALVNELDMLIKLKQDDGNAAWDHCISAQEKWEFARRRLSDLDIETHIERLNRAEVSFFPPQTYVSMGMIIKEARCSICNREYGG